ncbi:hypothetical protein BJX96DRAFT_158990 [Aspergillus floccosus]
MAVHRSHRVRQARRIWHRNGTIVAPRFYLACVGWTSFSPSRLLESATAVETFRGGKRSYRSPVYGQI